MSKVSRILDALRLSGNSTQRSALKRMDAQNEGKEILEERRRLIQGPNGPVEAFISTVSPVPEEVLALTAVEADAVLENASLVKRFIEIFRQQEVSDWGLPDLDQAFAAWIGSKDKRGYSSDTVIEITGAAFGQYCVEQLNMRWIRLTDQDGTTLAVEGIEKSVRAFPHQTVSKRIRDGEFGFFEPVFTVLVDQSGDAAPLATAVK